MMFEIIYQRKEELQDYKFSVEKDQEGKSMKLERGINLGGYLSQCVHNTEHYDAFIQEEDLSLIHI